MAGTMVHTVADHLREEILSLRLAPGSRIRQDDIAAELKVSRLPIRQALQLLAGEGLVVLEPYVGARVATVNLDDCIELYRIREHLEPLVVSDATLHMTADDHAELRHLLDEIDAAEDLNAWIRTDQAFHTAINEHCTLKNALGMINILYAQTQPYRRTFTQTLSEERITIAQMEHTMILNALERRDAEEAADRSRLHIRRTRMTLVNQFTIQEMEAP